MPLSDEPWLNPESSPAHLSNARVSGIRASAVPTQLPRRRDSQIAIRARERLCGYVSGQVTVSGVQ